MAGFHIFVKQRRFIGHSQGWPFFVIVLLFWSSCASYERLRDFGRIVLYQTNAGVNGFVIGVPHGAAESDAVDYAKTISDRTGAGLVIAYGFKASRIPVTQPHIHTTPISWSAADSVLPTSVFPEFKKVVRSAIVGPLKFYVGIRIAEEAKHSPRIEVASAGFSFEQLGFLKEAYAAIRNRAIKDMAIPKIEIALNPIDDISWNAFGAKNHGVLMLAEKGLILQMPKVLALPDFKSVYREIIANWIIEASTVARRMPVQMPEIQVKQLPYGRIDLIPSRNNSSGIVIGAPHGSFDWYTSELVEELSYRTSLPAVVTRGFTPTECGGWRINVNRPTERRYPTDILDRETERAKEVYENFRESVFQAARGPLDLYIDMHQNSSENNIDVATLGITREQARAIKIKYQEIRDRLLREEPEIAKVNLVIEPLDQVAIGAWAAKDRGVLRLAKTSLHFELPAQHIFYKLRPRRVYTKILAELIDSVATPDSILTRTGALHGTAE